jgi:putative membrane protein
MMFLWVLLLIAVILLIWYFTSQRNVEDWKIGKKESPMDILKRKYAEGKLSREEYEERKQTLEEERL